MNKLYQVSTIKALMLGNYDGVISVEDMLKQGNTGIGTFHGLDGEMILLDGKVYNGKANGTVEEYGNNEKVAFAAVSSINDNETSKEYTLQNAASFKELKEKLDEIIWENFKNKNAFYMIKCKANLNSIKIRSCFKQQKPYKTLFEVSESQKEYTFKNINGYLVGIYCPSYVEGLNMPGWHIHFLSEDKSKGGHILELAVNHANINMNMLNSYEIILPSNEEFKSLDLTKDLKKEIEKVEG